MEMLNEKSLEKITQYRREYAYYNKKDRFASSEYVLRFWEKEVTDVSESHFFFASESVIIMLMRQICKTTKVIFSNCRRKLF